MDSHWVTDRLKSVAYIVTRGDKRLATTFYPNIERYVKGTYWPQKHVPATVNVVCYQPHSEPLLDTTNTSTRDSIEVPPESPPDPISKLKDGSSGRRHVYACEPSAYSCCAHATLPA